MPNFIAIGNALVDTEFSVTDDILTQTGLLRGNMTLASYEEQTRLFEVLKQNQLAPSKQAGGGSAANSTAVFGALGGSSFYNCKVANDQMGQFYLADLADFGVKTNAEKVFGDDDMTGSCVVLVTPDGERTMQTHLGASANIHDDNVDFDKLSNADWLYIEGYLAMSPNIFGAISKLRQQAGVHGVGIVVSFADPAVVKFAKEGLLQLLGNGVKIIFCNLEEAQLFTEKKQHKACVKALLDYAEMVVVTNGKEPTLIGKRISDEEDEFIEIPTPVVKDVIDTNGAGDNFAGAFMYALSECYPLEKCGELASHVSAAVVQQFGARLPKEAYQKIKSSILN